MRRVDLGWLGCLALAASCGESSPSTHGSGGTGGAADLEAGAGGEDAIGPTGAGASGLGGSGDQTAGDGGMATAEGGAAGAAEQPVEGAVNGVVQRGYEPVVGVTVVLDDAMTTTKADGTFSFPNAAASYQLSIVSVASKSAYVFDGMTKRKPEIQFAYGFADQRSANIKGAISRSAPGTGAGQIHVAYFSKAQGTLGSQALSGDLVSFAVNAFWVGAATQKGKLIALATEPGNGSRTFVGYAEKTLSIDAGAKVGEDLGTLNAADITLVPIAGQHKLSGQVSVPAGYTLQNAFLDVGPFSFAITDNAAGVFTCDVPEDPALAPAVRFDAIQLGKPSVVSTVSVAVPASGNLSIDVPAGSTQLTPATGTTGVTTSTPFSWKPAADGIVTSIRFTVGDWHVWRITIASSTTIPDLGAYGFDYPQGALGYWIVDGTGPAHSVDESAPLMNPYSGLAAPSYVSTYTDDFAFTTAN